MKKQVIVLILIGFILFSSNVFAAGLPSTQNIQYNPSDSTDLIDWYNPTQSGATCNGTTPLIIWAHGGGFTAGTKILAYSLDPWKTLLANCYAIASVQYTLSPASSMATTPIMPFDLANAVKYFRKNDTNYNINENKIIAMGQSAGADIWMYPVYGPDMNLAGDDFTTQNARPNYFISIAGWTDINAMDNSTTGALYGQPTLATVSVADKNRMSMVYMLDQNAVLFPNRIIPTLFLYNGAADSTLPIQDPHDAYFGDLGLAKINQYNPNTGSEDYNLPLFTNNAPYILTWLNNNVGSALNTNPDSLTFFDDFNGYNTSYAANGSYSILYDFNNQTGWTIAEDFNNGQFVPGYGGKLSSNAVSWPLDMDKNSGNVSTVYRSISPNSVLRDWNSTGAYIYVMWKTDQNVEMTYLQIGLGQGVNDYEIWRKGPSTDWAIPWNNGWRITRYDLNSPFPGKVGNPSFTDINFLRISTAYTGSQVDFNLTIDRIWLENYPTSMDGTWTPVLDGNKLYGWGMPFTDQGSGLVLADTNILDTNSTGLILNRTFENINTIAYDFNIQVDVNQVNTLSFSKIVFDYSDPNNYSSCYIFDTTATDRKVGIERVTNGVRSFAEGSTTFGYMANQTITCTTTGSTATVKVGNTILQQVTIERVGGLFGLMSIGGTTKFQNYYNSLLLITSPDVVNGKVRLGTGLIDFDFFRDILFPLLIMALIVLSFFAAMKLGDIRVFFGGIIVVIITYILYNALFF